MYWNRAQLSANVCDLAVVRLDWTHWYWMGFVHFHGSVLKVGRHQHSRLEAMKDACCLASMHAGVDQDYSQGYWRRWRKLRLPFLDELICREERLGLSRRRARPKVQ